MLVYVPHERREGMGFEHTHLYRRRDPLRDQQPSLRGSLGIVLSDKFVWVPDAIWGFGSPLCEWETPISGHG